MASPQSRRRTDRRGPQCSHSRHFDCPQCGGLRREEVHWRDRHIAYIGLVAGKFRRNEAPGRMRTGNAPLRQGPGARRLPGGRRPAFQPRGPRQSPGAVPSNGYNARLPRREPHNIFPSAGNRPGRPPGPPAAKEGGTTGPPCRRGAPGDAVATRGACHWDRALRVGQQ